MGFLNLRKPAITQFKGKYDFLSNFHSCIIKYKGWEYPSVEHAYQSSKSNVLSFRNMCANRSISPGKIKRLGRIVKLIDSWDTIKFSVMEECLRIKFSDKNLRNKLLLTKGSDLIEGNTWGDKIWGVDLKTGEGQNHLGKLLMKIREEIK